EFQLAVSLPPPPLVLDLGGGGFFEVFDVAVADWSHTGPPSLLTTSCNSNLREGIRNAIDVVGYSAERSNRYQYALMSTPDRPTAARRRSWGALKAIYR